MIVKCGKLKRYQLTTNGYIYIFILHLFVNAKLHTGLSFTENGLESIKSRMSGTRASFSLSIILRYYDLRRLRPISLASNVRKADWRIGEERLTRGREPCVILALLRSDLAAHTGLFHSLSPQGIFALPCKAPRESCARWARKRGEKERAVERGERGNFSCAKYHADWLEVMKF